MAVFCSSGCLLTSCDVFSLQVPQGVENFARAWDTVTDTVNNAVTNPATFTAGLGRLW